MLNVKAFSKFVKQYFDNNASKCARAIGVNPSTIIRIINKQCNAGGIFVQKLIKYCVKNNIDYSIFLMFPMQKCSNDEACISNWSYHFVKKIQM